MIGRLILFGGGAAALLYLASNPAALGKIEDSLSGRTRPDFEPWLQQEIAQLIGPVSGQAPFRQRDVDFLAGAIRNRRVPDYYRNSPGDCGGGASYGLYGNVLNANRGVQLGVQTGQGISQVANLAGAAVKAIPVVGSIASFVTSIFSAVFGHHAQAVALEQNTLCQAVPLANQLMDQIDAAYRSGQISSAAAQQGLEQIYQEFVAQVAGILKPVPFSIPASQAEHVCNAACVYTRALRGVIDAKETFDY